MDDRTFLSGETVPATGIYRVTHSLHRLPHEVTLIANEIFPRCAKCAAEVRFKLVQAAPLGSFHVTLYQLPVLDDDDNGENGDDNGNRDDNGDDNGNGNSNGNSNAASA